MTNLPTNLKRTGENLTNVIHFTDSQHIGDTFCDYFIVASSF